MPQTALELCQELKKEIGGPSQCRKAAINSIIIGALGTIGWHFRT